MLLNVHDEWQLEVPKQFGEIVGELGVSAIQAAGVALGLRCPLDGEYKVGKNWAETH
jgi:DNA polymerase I-like protein with 3'-5' exonuclease and polymerase domains